MEELPPTEEPAPIKRKRGRPKGSKDKTKRERGESMLGGPREVPPTASRNDDFAHADPMTMLDRQLSMISWQQQALRWKMMGGRSVKDAMKEGPTDFRAGGKYTDPSDTQEILTLSNALARAIEAMKKHSDMATELASRLSGEQLLEAALHKIEGQSLPYLNYAIKRLRAKREALAPVLGLERADIGKAVEDEKATDAIASLLDLPQ